MYELILAIGSVAYILLATLWSDHAGRMQALVTTDKRKIALTCLLNFLFFPVCIIWSLFTKKKWDKIKHDHTKDWRNQ